MHVNEIFTALSGEPDGFNLQGGLATFVRLQGCNLDCKWCDTQPARALDGWKELTVDKIVNRCTGKHIIITGGEPLLQLEEVNQLVTILMETGHLVTIETNGSTPIIVNFARSRYEQLRFVVDYKLGSSGMTKYMLPEVFNALFDQDVIKFVMADLRDYRQAKRVIAAKPLWRAKIVFSPAKLTLSWPKQLAKRMIKDKLEGVILSLQLHKLLLTR